MTLINPMEHPRREVPAWKAVVYHLYGCYAMIIGVNVMIYGGLVGAISVGALCAGWLLWDHHRQRSSGVDAVEVRSFTRAGETDRAA